MTETKKISVWIEAMRLRTLPLSVAGIVAGSALAFRVQSFDWQIFIPALFTTLFLQILSNLANDYGDGLKGTDGKERIGPQRMTQSGLISKKEMLASIYLVTGLALSSGIYLLYKSFGPEGFVSALLFFGLGLASIWAAIKYTVGKNAYGYVGMGDLFVMIFFGFVSVVGSFFLYNNAFNFSENISPILQSITIGSFSVGVLHLNNMRDRISDEKSGKMTLAVKLGAKNSKVYFSFLILFGVAGSIIDSALTTLHITELLHSLLLFPPLILLLKVLKIEDPIEYNQFLKPLALSTFAYSIFLFISFIL